MNLMLAHAVFAEKRGRGAGGKRSSSESWNATGKCRKSSLTPPGSSYRARSGVRSPGSIIHSDGWRGYNGLVDMGYKKNFRVQHGDAGHMPNGGLQSSMLFPDKRSFYTSRNVNSDLVTERKISLIEYLTLLKENPL